jgi:uncharacterized protein (TIGR03435 family)
MNRFGIYVCNHGKLSLTAVVFVALAAPMVLSCVSAATARIQSRAQSAAVTMPAYEYEVSSIKLYKSANGDVGLAYTPDGITGTNVGLPLLIQLAYGIHNDQIIGAPGWFTSENYDIQAKMEGSVADALQKLNPEQLKLARQQMLQALLADRFKLAVHHETKDLPVYSLVIAKGGFKLQESKPDETDPQGRTGMHISGSSGAMRGQLVSMASLAQFLYGRLGRTVLDKTGLTGKYDFMLKWTPDQNQMQPAGGFQATSGGAPGGQPALVADAGAPDLFTAVQEQLGLKLESGKGPVEVIVIDHVERPSGN